MKTGKIMVLIGLVTVLFSCGNLKAPIYSGVKDVHISKLINDSIVFQANLNFKNPNKIGGDLFLNDLHTSVNTIDVGFLKDQKVKVPAKDQFSVPLEMKLSRQQLFNSKNGLLGSLLTSFLTNELQVKLEGTATFKKFLIVKKYPIKFTKKIKLNN